MSNFVRVPALIAAAIILALWFVMAVGGFLYAFTGEVPIFEILLSLTPITLLAAGTLYFTLAVLRALIRVGDQGIVYRTALRFYWMPYGDIASAEIYIRWRHVSSRGAPIMLVNSGHVLLLTPRDPSHKPVHVAALFGREDRLLAQGLNLWQRCRDEQNLDVATQPMDQVPEEALTLGADNSWGGDSPQPVQM